MKNYVSFLIFITALTLGSCTPLQQPQDDSTLSTVIEIPTEPSETVSPKVSPTDSEITYEDKNHELMSANDAVPDELLLQKLPEILQTMPKFMQYSDNPVYLSENSRVILAVTGNLNDDEINDLAVIIEFPAKEGSIGYSESEFGFGARHIYVLLGNEDGSHTIAHKNENLILERWMGGIFGDPLESIAIEEGTLIIKHYGGSSSRWGYDMRFSYENGQLMLISMTAISHSTHNANGEETICDFLNHKVERNTWANHEDKTYSLYSGELPAMTYLFDNTTFDEIKECASISFLPYLEHYQYDRFEKPLSLNISASQALDMVMMEHCPDFEKVYIPWSQENRDNYSKLLFYEVPDYYYQNEIGTLRYFDLDFNENDSVISAAKHCVIFSSSDGEKIEFYYVED